MILNVIFGGVLLLLSVLGLSPNTLIYCGICALYAAYEALTCEKMCNFAPGFINVT